MRSIEYRDEAHRDLPHVLKVSGGRSSGMLLMQTLHLLRADRGDLVIFNNTGAEHPATYEFLRRLTGIAEASGIPFLWTEFVTFEEKRKGEYYRRPSYRLVKPVPRSEDEPDGYAHRGEPFEESTSWRAFLPNRWNRSCTTHLKIFIFAASLSDWFEGGAGIPRQGHEEPEPGLTMAEAYARHRAHRGGLDVYTHARYRAYMMSRPHVRPAQRYSDYSQVGKVHGLTAPPEDFLGLTGIRADEPARVERLRGMQGNHEEIIYCPLVDWKVCRSEVNRYWAHQPTIDLSLPFDTEKSNCVFCPLKGAKALRRIAEDSPDDGTPASLGWWTDFERKYQREHVKVLWGEEDRAASGFFGEYLLSDPNGAHYGNLAAVPDEVKIECSCFD